MISEFIEGHRVQHIRDGLVGTVSGIEQANGPTSSALTYQIQWDNGSFESRVAPSEITAAFAL